MKISIFLDLDIRLGSVLKLKSVLTQTDFSQNIGNLVLENKFSQTLGRKN